jgi:hypothetical protein
MASNKPATDANLEALLDKAASDANVAALIIQIKSLISLIGSGAVAAGLSGAPATDTLSVQGNNEQKLLGKFSIDAVAGSPISATLIPETSLSTNSLPFTVISIDCDSIAPGLGIALQGRNDPSFQWKPIQLQFALNSNTAGQNGGASLFYYYAPYAFVRAFVSGTPTASGLTVVAAHLSKGVPTLRNMTVSGASAIGSGFSQQPVAGGLCARSVNVPTADGALAAALATLEGAAVQKPYSIASADWSVPPAPSGGLVSTTPFILAPAVAGKRNFLTSLILDRSAISAPVEFIILEGANTKSRGIIPAGSGHEPYPLPNPLAGSVGAALALVLGSSPSGGGVYPIGCGYVAT